MGLKIQNLSLSFGEKKIFDSINLEIFPGEILIVKGINGSGKTSFLRSLAGFFSFDKNNNNKDQSSNFYFQKNSHEFFLDGKIFCEEFDISEHQEKYFHTRSFIPAHFEFCDEFDVKFYLKFWDKINQNEDEEKKIDAAIRYFGLEPFLENEIREISSGWKKRLQYSKFIFENRPIWILDEPLNFLDNDGKSLIIGMINAKILSGGIVIISDHLGEIEKFLNFEAEENRIHYLNL